MWPTHWNIFHGYFVGYAAKSWYDSHGNGANTLCLAKDPEFLENVEGNEAPRNAGIHGVEYRVSNTFLRSENLENENVPCAVCEVPRTSVLMLPAKRTCPQGWTLEYEGLVMAGNYNHNGQSEYICVSLGMETIPGGSARTDGGLLFVVEIRCHTLLCPPYEAGYELSCVVCTK